MSIEPYQLLDIAKNVLIQMGIHNYTDVQLTRVLKSGNEWRVTVSYTEKGNLFKTESSFAVDTESGKLIGFWRGLHWKA